MSNNIADYSDEIIAGLGGESETVEREERPHLPQTTTATELIAMELPPVQWIVSDMLPVGSSAIVAASKIGKSWMVLDILLTVAMGGSYMGHACPQRGVLYLALEDSNNRMQSRMKKVLDGRPAPANFHFATEWGTLDNTFYSDLEAWIKAHPDVQVVAVDVLQRVRGAVRSKESSYGADYREIGGLKRFFDSHGLSLILIHHTRKNVDSSDPYDAISGTNGIMGALDTVWVILKDRRDDDHATLHIIGRDVNQQELTIRFNKESGRWENLGSADWFAEERKRKDHESNPVVITLKSLLADTGRWRGSTTELMREMLHKTGQQPSSTVKFGRDIKALVPSLSQYDGIQYEPIKNGSAPPVHVFYWPGFNDSSEAEQEEIPTIY